MGFWDLAKDVLGAARESAAEYRELQAKYESYSDEQLKGILRSSFSSMKEKTAANKVLKERGYDNPFRDALRK